MRPSQHLNSIVNKVTPAIRKYLRGAKEHGGGLWKKNVGPEINNELLDLIVYQFTFSEQVKKLVAAAKQMEDHDWFEWTSSANFMPRKGLLAGSDFLSPPWTQFVLWPMPNNRPKGGSFPQRRTTSIQR
jgi:hypothetical protein